MNPILQIENNNNIVLYKDTFSRSSVRIGGHTEGQATDKSIALFSKIWKPLAPVAFLSFKKRKPYQFLFNDFSADFFSYVSISYLGTGN